MTAAISDNTLTALALREHAQTCDEIAIRHPPGSAAAKRWVDRAQRCRDLATRHDKLSKLNQS